MSANHSSFICTNTHFCLVAEILMVHCLLIMYHDVNSHQRLDPATMNVEVFPVAGSQRCPERPPAPNLPALGANTKSARPCSVGSTS